MPNTEAAQTAQTAQAAAQQQAQLGQVEQTVRGVGEAIGEALTRQLREDAPDAENLERTPPAWDGSPEHWPAWSSACWPAVTDCHPVSPSPRPGRFIAPHLISLLKRPLRR